MRSGSSAVPGTVCAIANLNGPGQTVLVRFGPGPKGLMASEVRPDGGPHMLASH